MMRRTIRLTFLCIAPKSSGTITNRRDACRCSISMKPTRVGKEAMDTMLKSYSTMAKGFQTLATEASDYSKKSLRRRRGSVGEARRRQELREGFRDPERLSPSRPTSPSSRRRRGWARSTPTSPRRPTSPTRRLLRRPPPDSGSAPPSRRRASPPKSPAACLQPGFSFGRIAGTISQSLSLRVHREGLK